MFVRAVAGIDDAGVEPLGQKLRRAGGTVAQNDNVGVVRLEIARGVLERFAFGQAGGGRRNVDDIRAQAKRGQLERSARARARFDEKIHQRLAAQRRHLFDLAGADLLEGVRGIENEIDFLGGKFANAEQIFSCPAHGHVILAGIPADAFILVTSQTASGSSSISRGALGLVRR